MKKTHYLAVDIKRLFKDYKIYFAIIGVMVSLLFSLEDQGIGDSGVIMTYIISISMSGYMIAFVFCAFSYATVFCEDLENKYIRYQIIRGELKKYVISKVFVIYVASVFTMIMGTILFVLLCHVQIPWVSLRIDELDIAKTGCYAVFLEDKKYLFYCVICATHLGMLAGSLSVFAAFISLYISNKMTVLILPVVVNQILMEVAGDGKFTVFAFKAYNKFFVQDWQNFLFATALSLIPVFLLTIGIFKKIKTRL